MKKYLIAFLMLFCFFTTYAKKVQLIVETKLNLDKKELAEKPLAKGVHLTNVFPMHSKQSGIATTLSGNNEFKRLSNFYICEVDESELTSVMSQLRNNENVAEISQNTIFSINTFERPNDVRFEEMWALKEINALMAWRKATGKGIVIGLVDTGIDYEHPELRNNLWINEKEDLNKNGRFDPWLSTEIVNGVAGDLNGIDEDGNGFADDVIGYDFINQTIPNIGDWSGADPIPQDEGEHGTVVAGVMIAEGNNQNGIIGLAYESKVMAIRAFDATGNGEADDIAQAIVYAALNGARVLNFSFGEYAASPIVHAAIKFAESMGCIMVASTGNDNNDKPHFPSDYSEVIAVGASTSKSVRWGDSNYGGNIQLLAPGSLVLTTVRGGYYSLKSGTSLAAPYVSAAVALLLELDPSLSSSQVQSILTASAKPISPAGWDYSTGAGILDIGKAIDEMVNADFSISEPQMYSVYDRNATNALSLSGSVFTPLLDDYSILIGKGKNPRNWDTLVGQSRNTAINKLLASISLDKLADTNYTISIVANLKNNQSLEQRVQFEVLGNSKPFQLKSLTTYNVYYEDIPSVFIYAESNADAYFELSYRVKGTSGDYSTLSDMFEKSKYHQILISDPNLIGKTIEAIAKLILPSQDTIVRDLEFSIDGQVFPKYSFVKKSYSYKRSYICSIVEDIDGNGTPNILYNDLSSLSIGKTFLSEFANGKFNILDSLNDGWIPIGIGNSNGDNYSDILLYGNGRTFVYQRTSGSPSPFAEKIFSSETFNFWGERYYDFDKDGRDDILAYNDSSFFVFSYTGSGYKLLAQANVPKEYGKITKGRGSAVGDFDGDGNIELYHSDNSAHSIIFEYKNNQFNLEYYDASFNGLENQYISQLDINGDGRDEIIHGTYGFVANRSDKNHTLWKFKIIGSDAANSYNTIDSILIYGVRAGIIPRFNASYRNGVAGGSLMDGSSDQLIISAMPNLYVFDYDANLKKFKPLWYYPASYTNSAIIYDFDKNGKNEIGFSSFSATEFWEYSSDASKLNEPIAEGYAENDSTAILSWLPVENSDTYEVLALIDDKPSFSLLGTTSNTKAIISGLSKRQYHSLFVVAKDKDDLYANSELSNEVRIFMSNRAKMFAAEATSSKTIVATYDGDLTETNPAPSKFLIVDKLTSKKYDVISTVALAGKVVLELETDLLSGDYTIEADSVKDYYGNPTEESIVEFSYSEPILKEEIYLSRIELMDKSLLKLEYSTDVDSSALLIENYEIKPFGEVKLVSPEPNNSKMFDLLISYNPPLSGRGRNYSLTAKNITSGDGKRITTGAGNTLSFVIAESDFSKMFVYPHPIRNSSDDRIFIGGLTKNAKLVILTLDGEELIELKESDGNGGVEWSGLDKTGKKLMPGTYLIKASNTENTVSDFEIIKFVVLP